MPKQEICKVVRHEAYSDELFALTIHAPEICALAKPGQFVHISCGEGNMLRRPISICDVIGDEMKIVFQVKGDGTKWLSKRTTGHTIDVLGPLGHGFDIEKLGSNPVFIGGGIGVPPMLYTMKNAKANGADVSVILGFKSKDSVIMTHDFEQIGVTHVCTNDGTYGTNGFVTDILKLHLDSFTGIAACGPKPMLKAVAAMAQSAGIHCQVSMEERMGCGIGACLVCACELKLRDGEEGVRYGHVCKDGPVFDAKEVVW